MKVNTPLCSWPLKLGDWFIISLFIALAPNPNASADSSRPITRKVVAFYNPEFVSRLVETYAHSFVEMPLNHLGLEVVHRALDKPLPSKAEMNDVRGIFIWMDQDYFVPRPIEFCKWANGQMRLGKRLVVFGYPGGFMAPKSIDLSRPCHKMFRQLGASYVGLDVKTPLAFKIVKKDPQMVEFERELNLADRLSYTQLIPNPDTKAYLTLERNDLENSRSAVVFTSQNGGFVYQGYAVFSSLAEDRFQWRIDPFRFFEIAYGTRGLPRPDTTTLFGHRIFYSHLDGDGIFNISYIDRKSYSAEIILNYVLKQLPKVPITMSFVTGYFNIKRFNNERTHRLYQGISQLPHIEIGSHGHGHPLIWQAEDGEIAIQVDGYTYEPKMEIVGSTNLIQQLLDREEIDKKVTLFQWTGDCNPSAEQLGITYEHGLFNINGGDPKFDKRYPSYTSVAPIGILKGKYRQFFASASNENLYTNLWEGPFFGFEKVIDTFKNTEAPIRIKPINVYYHYYSGEHIESLAALKEAYAYALSQPIFAIKTSDYVRLAMDFFNTQIWKRADGGFDIQNKGHLKTIRFDHEKRHVDMARSKGVLGFQNHGEVLYIHLDEQDRHTVFLTSQKPKQPYWIRSSFYVRKFRGDSRNIRFSKHGWHKSEGVIGGLMPNETYVVSTAAFQQTLKTDRWGQLHLEFPMSEGWQPETVVQIQLE